jgi:superfamily II DNA or RNA helicase
MIDLRPYQTNVIEQLMAAPSRRSLLVAPTGSGKTVIASEIIHRSVDKHILFLAHRRELIFQTQRHLAEFGVSAGTILAGEKLDLMCGVQVASIQTLWSRCMRGSTDLPHADLIFVDEAHHARSRTWQRTIEAYPSAKIIGMTATPCRRDGRGLGNIFESMVECPQVPELIEMGYLVGTKVFAPSRPDLTGVTVRQGDYAENQLAERMDRAELVGDIVSHWHRLATGRKTVVFATSVAHSVHLTEEFAKSGVKAEHIDGSTPKDERDAILDRLSAGDIEVVVNCMVLTEGWDQPDVACIVLARPTKSMGLYRQMVGRGLRPFEGKDHCLVLDHAGAVFQHGFVEDPVRWYLDVDEKAENEAHESRQLSPSDQLLECSQCRAIRTAGKPCGNCGFMPKRAGQHLDVIDGDLAHLERNGRQHPQHWSDEQKREFFQGLLYLTISRGHKPGAAAYRFKDRFGEWPTRHWQSLDPQPPTPEVAAWDRHCRIKYAKAMASND